MMYEFMEKINYKFKDERLIKQAFIHSSYAHESKMDPILSNERLEFLGDAVLELVISNYLFNQYPELPEGELTKYRASLVCETSLAKKAAEIGMGEYLFLGKGEELSHGRQRESILADTFEAVVGAIYLDGGTEPAREFLWQVFKTDIKEGYNFLNSGDYKTYLQEIVQKTNKDGVRYEIISEKGPDHNKTFVAQVFDDHKLLGEGTGKSKKDAEQNAALQAISRMGIK